MMLNAYSPVEAKVDYFKLPQARNDKALTKRGWKSQGFKPPYAVIDWVTFIVDLKRNSHGGYLKTRYEGIGVSYARPLDAGAGGSAKRFQFRLQHPANFGVIDALLADLDENYGLAYPAELEAMEVSIDFYHESGCPLALSAMTERLMHAVTPPVVTNPRIYGDCFDMAGGSLPSAQSTITADRTLYIGNVDDDLMWRVYLKRTDDTYVGEDGKRVPKPIPPTEWRARVEVRLQGGVLKKQNLTHVRDLEKFSFEKLHSAKLFKFTKRVDGGKPLLTNPWLLAAAKSIGDGSDWPSCIVNRRGRRDNRGRMNQISCRLTTDTELTEASRQALRGLTARFGRAV